MPDKSSPAFLMGPWWNLSDAVIDGPEVSARSRPQKQADPDGGASGSMEVDD